MVNPLARVWNPPWRWTQPGKLASRQQPPQQRNALRSTWRQRAHSTAHPGSLRRPCECLSLLKLRSVERLWAQTLVQPTLDPSGAVGALQMASGLGEHTTCTAAIPSCSFRSHELKTCSDHKMWCPVKASTRSEIAYIDTGQRSYLYGRVVPSGMLMHSSVPAWPNCRSIPEMFCIIIAVLGP